jgi:hypothetical protein
MLRTKMFSLITLTSAFAGGLALLSFTDTATAGSEPTELCAATGIQTGPGAPGGCQYSSADAPVIAVNVCWDGSTARLKGLTECPGNDRTYYVKFGELLNPMTGEIVAYAPLASACTMMACEQSDINSAELPDTPVCCDGSGCTTDVANCTDEILWCEEITYDNQGNLICHEE